MGVTKEEEQSVIAVYITMSNIGEAFGVLRNGVKWD